MTGDGVIDDSGKVMACGIAAGATWYALRDLAEKAAQLPPGELRDTWVSAAASMMELLNDAQQNAKLR